MKRMPSMSSARRSGLPLTSIEPLATIVSENGVCVEEPMELPILTLPKAQKNPGEVVASPSVSQMTGEVPDRFQLNLDELRASWSVLSDRLRTQPSAWRW